jgi:hypothetical protein
MHTMAKNIGCAIYRSHGILRGAIIQWVNPFGFRDLMDYGL